MTIAEKIKAASQKVAQEGGSTSAPEVTTVNSASLKTAAKSGVSK